MVDGVAEKLPSTFASVVAFWFVLILSELVVNRLNQMVEMIAKRLQIKATENKIQEHSHHTKHVRYACDGLQQPEQIPPKQRIDIEWRGDA